MLTRLHRPLLALTACAGLLASIAPAAHADTDYTVSWIMPGYGSGHSPERPMPPVSMGDVLNVTRALALDDDQRLVLEDAHAELMREFRLMWTVAAEDMADARNSNGVQIMGGAIMGGDNQDPATVVRKQYAAKVQDLEARFYEDLTFILTPAQEAQFADLMKRVERKQQLEQGSSIEAEKHDLDWILAGLDIDDRTRSVLAETMNAYNTEMESLLRTRAARLKPIAEGVERFAQLGNMWDPMREDDGGHEKIMEDLSKLAGGAVAVCKRIAELNNRTKEVIASQLRGEPLEQFQNAVGEEFSPWQDPFPDVPDTRPLNMVQQLRNIKQMVEQLRIMQATMPEYATRYRGYGGFDMGMSADSLEPLSDEQSAQLDEIVDAYLPKLKAIVAKYPEVAKQFDYSMHEHESIQLTTEAGVVYLEPEWDEDDMQDQVFDENAWMKQQENMQAYQKAVSEIDLATVKQIRAILTMDQRAIIAMW